MLNLIETAVDLDEPLRDFWQRRLASHTFDTYRGRALSKMPEDLRTYQHIIEAARPEVIVELGTYQGGSALWFADQLDLFSQPRHPSVISVDRHAVEWPGDARIAGLTGDLHDGSIVAEVHRLVDGRRALVSEDSAHVYETSRAALDAYSDLVPAGSWFVVEDAVVDEEELRLTHYPRGVARAIEDFLASEAGARFERHHLAPYGLTTCHGGWLLATA